VVKHRVKSIYGALQSYPRIPPQNGNPGSCVKTGYNSDVADNLIRFAFITANADDRVIRSATSGFVDNYRFCSDHRTSQRNSGDLSCHSE